MAEKKKAPVNKGADPADVKARTIKNKADFLLALAETGNVSRACSMVGATRSNMYGEREADAEFAAAWDKAKSIGIELLEDEAMRRAHDGVDEPVFHQGVAVDTVKKYSDPLLMFLLKGAKPEKYRDNHKLDISGGTKNEVRIVSEFGSEDGDDS